MNNNTWTIIKKIMEKGIEMPRIHEMKFTYRQAQLLCGAIDMGLFNPCYCTDKLEGYQIEAIIESIAENPCLIHEDFTSWVKLFISMPYEALKQGQTAAKGHIRQSLRDLAECYC